MIGLQISENMIHLIKSSRSNGIDKVFACVATIIVQSIWKWILKWIRDDNRHKKFWNLFKFKFLFICFVLSCLIFSFRFSLSLSIICVQNNISIFFLSVWENNWPKKFVFRYLIFHIFSFLKKLTVENFFFCRRQILTVKMP
mgnify:CR=1 FL=1